MKKRNKTDVKTEKLRMLLLVLWSIWFIILLISTSAHDMGIVAKILTVFGCAGGSFMLSLINITVIAWIKNWEI